ncbi:hypothetical protein THAOC_13919 [Thalassiosira oceanica]|uniref:Uncharacterized protein n=1 Tax=Thalassiosira oceanica TaxID=159749 RepID=K0SIW8_THAOC|nr:hypothetical protein THAOC_13919 [Thalassiosira oceanica]|eukprot:EJK65245.1 hypothetical protein THAOC_13919 [Thalassiosira oceanica]
MEPRDKGKGTQQVRAPVFQGRTNPHRQFLFDNDNRSDRSAWKVAHSEAPGPGITERALEGTGKARKGCIRRKFATCLRQRVPFIGNTRPARRGGPRPCRASCGPNRREVLIGMGRKVASRKALAELYKRLPIEVSAARADRAREEKRSRNQEKKNSRHACVTCDSIVISKDTRRTAAASRRPTQLPPGAVAKKKTRGVLRRRPAMRRRLEDRRSSTGGLAEGRREDTRR